MNNIKLLVLFLGSFAFSCGVQAEYLDLRNWKEINFSSESEIEASKNLIQVKSNAAATAYYYEFPEPITEEFLLSWQWRTKGNTDLDASNFDPLNKSQDDFTARVYVVFSNTWKNRAINYVALERDVNLEYWSNPFSKYSIMIPRVLSTDFSWQREEALPWHDYMRVFGEAPSEILGIAIMSDTDNAHGDVETHYKNITVELIKP